MKRPPREPVTTAQSAWAGDVRAGPPPAGDTDPARDSDRPLGLLRPHHALSDRELQVLRHLAAGRAIKEIALSLAVSEKTVSTYRTRLLEKMCMRSNEELRRYARAFGLGD